MAPTVARQEDASCIICVGAKRSGLLTWAYCICILPMGGYSRQLQMIDILAPTCQSLFSFPYIHSSKFQRLPNTKRRTLDMADELTTQTQRLIAHECARIIAKMMRVFLFTPALAASVAADDGDDFVNNLFSDLAPLLALFGERVTMQFMSQSLGWADNIVLAMNGHYVVRCIGSAPVANCICLLPESGVNDGVHVEVMPFHKVKNQYFAENESPRNLLRKAMSLNSSTSAEQDKEKLSHSKNTAKSRIIITRNPRKSSPKITLNSHNITSRTELRIAAVWGVMLQLGLIAYAGCSVHYPSLGFLKDGEPVAQYAFPCHWAGTLLLVVGLLLGGHVVESSTIEEVFRPSRKLTAQLVWLQQTKTVSDQVFDSFAIYAKTQLSFITTSERRRDERKPPAPSLNQEVMLAITPVNEKLGISIEMETSIGTVVSLCGYIVQFCGMRGLHWSVSIAQLGAILLMAALRAWTFRIAGEYHHERLQHWQQAGSIYLWLFRIAGTFPLDDDLPTLATVIIVDFLRQVYSALDLTGRQRQMWDKSNSLVDLSLAWARDDSKREIRSRSLESLEVASTFGDNNGYSRTNARYHEKFRYTNLHEVALTRNRRRIEDAFYRGEDVNVKDILGWTPLHYGARRHCFVKNLIFLYEADVNARDLVEWTPLHYACNFEGRPDDGSTERHETIGSSSYDNIWAFLAGGAHIDAQGRDDVAPIHCAAIAGFLEAVKLLTKTGADINVRDASGKTALHWAAFHGNQTIVEYLWKIANRTLRDREGRTDLHLAVKWKTATWLVNNDADVMARDRLMRIPLHQAAWAAKLDVVQLMYEENPTAMNTSDCFNLTPLYCAVQNGQEAVVQWLLEHTRAEVNHILQGNSLVLSAIRESHADVVEILIKHGANVTSRSRYGRSLLHESILYGNEEITEMLLKAGARNGFDDDVNSVIKMTKGNEKQRVSRSLLEKYDVNLGEN
ncbi:uncharacterized protein CLUP02_14927 [Colletotrichum lupini]|uniref:Ankyrin repeat protein n=1 Tax=Colletotrichum lupini TaxID=145971 RepID=A0A9Q8T547_9PEZI|nr:uncharacterized protein CLUP02_14927 [Colletotrichum lupini]UQC89398.1 hypothetical protein CLUP02_14927 [Colletotrichum lupini]